MNQLNDISLVAQVVVFRNTKAFDQAGEEVPITGPAVLPESDLRRQRIE